MGEYVVGLHEVGRSAGARVGGKGASLGELNRVEGVLVPDGFCVTTAAFERAMSDAPSVAAAIEALDEVDPGDQHAVGERATGLRDAVASMAMPDEVASAIVDAVAALDPDAAWAVRSSATAEDLPSASFAGQHDSFLDVVGADAVLDHVARCWASLFTDRAVAYRTANGFGHRDVTMAVVVQRMVPAEASGVAFTADPVTGNRRIVAIEAVAGLGDALVSGQVDPDRYEVRDGELLTGTDGGVLTSDQALELAALARRIEAHLDQPQDIEWCLADGRFHVVQSRPITTLFPVPEVADDEPHVYVSVGHQQMMTDPMKPLGLSVWQLTAARPMHVAAGRLFVDVGANLASPTARAAVIGALGRSDPLIGDALQQIVDRGDLVPERPDPDPADAPPGPPAMGLPPVDPDPALVAELIAEREASLAELADRLDATHGPAVFDVIVDDLGGYQQLFDGRSIRVIMSAIESSWWLDEQLESWLGERGAADVLTRSAPGNVTSEMGLALLDVADVIRPHADVVAYLRSAAGDDGFLDGLAELGPAGVAVRAAFDRFLAAYGMRCVGEIDITRPRWREQPSMLLPVVLGNVDHQEPGAGVRRFEQGRLEAEAKAADVLARLRTLPDGEAKAAEAERHIAVVRTFIGFREFPKYAMVRRYFLYKQALLREVERLVADGVLREDDDAWFLTLAELAEVARTGDVDLSVVDERRAAFRTYATMTPPRVMTSDGEVITGRYGRSEGPEGALVGLAVSAGTVEGRARVVHDVAGADLRPGDVLVTTHTDPSWSPVFASIAGLVTEVGGVMTHGAVVAREYGLPAVVGVVDATKLIRDGQRIRVHGTDGHVELLPD